MLPLPTPTPPVRVLSLATEEPIANDGTVLYRKHERVAFSWLVAQKFYGEPAQLGVLRDGQVLDLHLEDLHPQAGRGGWKGGGVEGWRGGGVVLRMGCCSSAFACHDCLFESLAEECAPKYR